MSLLNTGIIKAEMLWTKKCPFHCSFCGMVQNKREQEQFQLSRWQAAMENLKNIGCQFIAIYGAEPLSRMENLDTVIKMQRDLGIEQTVITALYQPHKIKKLIEEAGLRSVSVSYDMMVEDEDRTKKSSNGIRLLSEFPVLEDRACITTLSRENSARFLTEANEVLDNGYWLLFDMVHPGYPGVADGYPVSKCIGDGVEYDFNVISNIFNTLIQWKKEGRKVHASIQLLEYMRDNIKADIRSSWHCANHNTLGWVTFGPNLELYYCDDCQVKYKKPLDQMTSEKDWEEFLLFRNIDSRRCPGCFWNTHIGAIQVVDSGELDTYVHVKANK